MMTRRTMHGWQNLLLMGVLVFAFYSAGEGCRAADDALYSVLTNDIQAIGELDASQAMSQLAAYRNHADNRSRLDRRSRTEESETVRFSRKAQRILAHNLDSRFDGRRDSEADIDVLSTMTAGKALGIISALEDEKNFNAAAMLASKFVDRELVQDQQDLFCLIAARNIWFSRNKQLRARYQELIDKARQSNNGRIADEARLWVMAVKAPGSYDAICLSQQIWETLFYDIGDRNRSFYMSNLIGEAGPQVIDRIIIDEEDDEFMEIQVAGIASFVSEAGYQAQEGAWTRYAEEIVTNMVYPDPEDLAAITYYRGMYEISLNRYQAAAEYFEKVFVSDVTPDIEFEAGYRLAVCQAENRDFINAKATLGVLQEWYPDNKRIDVIKKFDKYIEPQLKDDTKRLVSDGIDALNSKKMANLQVEKPIETAKLLNADNEG